MAVMNFPDNPNIGDEFTNTVGRTWIWTGSTWKSKTTDFLTYVSDTTDVHGISDTANLAYLADLQSKQDIVPNVSDQEIGYLSNVTSDIQDQLDNKASSTHTHPISDIDSITATAFEINQLGGVTSNIQDQLDLKATISHNHQISDITDFDPADYTTITGVETLTNKTLTSPDITTPTITGDATFNSGTLHVDSTNNRIGINTTTPSYQVEIKNTGSNALLALNRTDGAGCFIEGQVSRSAFGSIGPTPLALAYNSLAVVNIGEGGAITVNPDGASPFTLPTSDGGANQVLATDGSGNVGWASKQDPITGAATTVVSDDLAALRALASDVNGKITATAVTSTELGYLGGVTSDIQSQIDSKASSSHTHSLADITDVTASASEVNILDGVTTTTAQINYLSNTTSDVQAQIDAKASLSGATFTGDLEIPNVTITGNLLVQGTTTTINTTDYAIRDNMIYMNQAGVFDITNAVGNGTTVTYTAPGHDFVSGDYVVVTGMDPAAYNIAGTSLITIDSVSGDDFVVTKSDTGTFVSGGSARGKSAANPDLGWAAGRTTAAGYGHTGVFRDASDATFKFFDGYTPEPDESLYIDTGHASFALAPIAVSQITTGGITATGTVDLSGATVSGVSLDDLSNVTETSSSTGDVLYYDGTSWVNKYINAIPAISSSPTLTSGNYNLVASDAGKILEINNSGAATITIPDTESYAVGTQIMILQVGSGDAQVSVTVQSPAVQTINYSPGNKLRGQWAAATLLKRSSNTWVLYGDLTA